MLENNLWGFLIRLQSVLPDAARFHSGGGGGREPNLPTSLFFLTMAGMPNQSRVVLQTVRYSDACRRMQANAALILGRIGLSFRPPRVCCDGFIFFKKPTRAQT